MEHKTKKLVAFISCVFFVSSAFAGAGWTGFKKIVSSETHAAGTEIRLEGFNGACTNLTAEDNKTWTRIGATQDNKEQLVSVALMAFASEKLVNIHCAGDDWSNLKYISVVSS